MIRHEHMRCAAAVGLVGLVGCGALGEGDVVVRATAGPGVEQGFPFVPDDDDDGASEVAFADGWTLRFDRYLVSVGDLRVADGSDVGARSEAVYVFDLAGGTVELEELIGLEARRWDSVSFAVRAPEAGETVKLSGGATDEDAALLRDAGIDYFVEGHAEKDGRMVTFAWGLDNPTDAADCTHGDDGPSGIAVERNRVTEAVLTFHVEHMFWDRLGHEQTTLRFDAIAAMADADGDVPWMALSEQSLADPVDADGEPLFDANGNRVVYDAGTTELPRDDLQQFILAATRTQAHLDDDGLCTVTAR